MQLIFGPVNSRRFGNSLGVDLSPQTKQCNFDCLYCELAPAQPVQKQNYTVHVDEVLSELEKHLNSDIDVITITANGEPTLYPHLDELIDAINDIKEETKTLILTNSASLTDEKTYKTLLKLDKVKLSLDAVTPEVFKKIDRPVKGVEIETILDAMERFSHDYQGELYIEILFVKGLNDTGEEIQKLNTCLLKLNRITRVDIGTIDRPPAYHVEALSFKELHTIASKFENTLPIYITGRETNKKTIRQNYTEEEILNTLDKRPLALADIETLFDKDSLNRFQALVKNNKITTKKVGNIEFFLPSKNFYRKRAKNS